MSTAFDWFPAPAHVTTSTTPANVTITPVVNGALLSGASLSLRNLSGGDITAVSVSVSVDGTTYGPTRSVTAGLPLAAGAALAIEVSDTEAASYRLTVTAASAGKADVVFLDEPAVRRPVTALRIAGTDAGGTAGGTSLPTATGAGEVLVSTGAGTTYTATSAGEVVPTGLSAALSEEVVGTAVIADGDGGVSFTSADVSAFLASANAAAARTALGGYESLGGTLAAGQGWTLSAAADGCVWSYETGGVGRLTMASSGNLHDLQGPSIERAFTFDPGSRYRVRVTPLARVSTSGVLAGVYLRSASAICALWWHITNRTLYTGSWSGGLYARGADGFDLDGTDSMELRVTPDGVLTYVAIGSTGLARVLAPGAELPFLPTHFGLMGACDGATVATVDFSGLRLERFG